MTTLKGLFKFVCLAALVLLGLIILLFGALLAALKDPQAADRSNFELGGSVIAIVAGLSIIYFCIQIGRNRMSFRTSRLNVGPVLLISSLVAVAINLLARFAFRP